MTTEEDFQRICKELGRNPHTGLRERDPAKSMGPNEEIAMKYTVIYWPDVDVLIQTVNARIAEGWTPIGGILKSDNLWAQAMTLLRPAYGGQAHDQQAPNPQIPKEEHDYWAKLTETFEKSIASAKTPTPRSYRQKAKILQTRQREHLPG